MPSVAAGRTVEEQRASVREALWDALPEHCRESVRACLPRLLAELPRQPLAANTVMVAFGGGKDSAYTTAFVRAIHLELYREHGESFRLRILTNRHAGMPLAVMENVGRTFAALGIEDDPDCEALLVDGDVVRPFRVHEPRPPELVERNRLDILMSGHRTMADGRPTFCNACNLSVANSFGIGASHGGGADVIVTGDSPEEQRAYLAWIRGLARQLGVEPQRGLGFKGLLSTLDGIGQVYFGDIHGDGGEAGAAGRRVASDVPAQLRFFSIYDDTAYESGDHWDLLTGFLGFAFDRLAFSFTESDCANPALMAHLRGLKAERLFERGYEEGLAEYVEFALGLMRTKEIPEELVEMVAERYRGPEAPARMRAAMEDYALDTFGLSDEQLVCMVYSPFVGNGERLDAFLEREHPELGARVDEARAALTGEDADPELIAALERLSGLTLGQLRVLYERPSPPKRGMTSGSGIVGAILESDPHKAVIATRHRRGGPVVEELISGR
jgi:hypothetical protein